MDAIDEDPSDAAREALRARINEYMTKALREAKLHTSWINVNTPYEQGVAQFIDLLLQPSSSGPFVAELRGFVGGILVPGICNSLSQLVLKITAPGVPDIYQGTELWDLSLVDPDNRRPIDFEVRRALLSELGAHDADRPALATELLRRPADGRVKLLVASRALQHRRRHRALYDRGAYQPLAVEGSRARNAFAFARTLEGDASITVVGRLLASISPDRSLPLGESAWGDTRIALPPTLPHTAYREIVTGAVVEPEPGQPAGFLRLSRAFANVPVAVLEPM